MQRFDLGHFRMLPKHMELMLAYFQDLLTSDDTWGPFCEFTGKGLPGQVFRNWVAEKIGRAELVLWSEQVFLHSVFESAGKLEDLIVSSDSWPDQDQLWVLDSPMDICWRSEPSVRQVLVAMCFLKHNADKMIWGAFLSAHGGVFPSLFWNHLSSPVVHELAVLLAGNAFLQSTIVSTWKAKIKKRHKLTKQEKRLGMKKKKAQLVHEVKVVRLRKIVRPTVPSGAEGGSTREYSCRWFVQGHLRNQPYPSLGTVRPLWINGYVKGPKDKPLKDPAKIVYYANR